MTDLPTLLDGLSRKGVFLHPPASFVRRAQAVADLAERGLALPADYQAFLERADGLEGLGVFLFGSDGLPRSERHEPQPGLALQNVMREGQLPDGATLVGKTVEHLWIVYDHGGRQYQLRDGLTGDVFSTYPSIERLLQALLSGQPLF